jgi:hypothetical protein
MMLLQNLPRILAETRSLDRVLDIGGSAGRLNTATHVLDLLPLSGKPLSDAEPVREATFIKHDVCSKPWPFADRYFEYAFCSHTLEDIRDPIGACEELMRVARRGYIEAPSRLREIFHTKRFMRLRAILGRPVRVGFGHHRWFCEQHGDGLTFIAKTFTALQPRFVVTRGELGRELTAEESCIGFFWDGPFPVRERILITNTEEELASFKRIALARVTGKSSADATPTNVTVVSPRTTAV